MTLDFVDDADEEQGMIGVVGLSLSAVVSEAPGRPPLNLPTQHQPTPAQPAASPAPTDQQPPPNSRMEYVDDAKAFVKDGQQVRTALHPPVGSGRVKLTSARSLRLAVHDPLHEAR